MSRLRSPPIMAPGLYSDFCLQTNKFCYAQNQYPTLLIGGIEVPEGKKIC